MARDRREAFKIGVLQRCAEAGLTPEETTAFAKEAAEQLRKSSGSAIIQAVMNPFDTLLRIGEKAVTGYAMPLTAFSAITAPPALGYAAGRGVAKATDIDDEDVKNLKKRELVEMYRAQARRLQGG